MKLTFSTPEILTRAVQAGLAVHWQTSIYTVRGADLDSLFIDCATGNTVGLHWPSYPVNQFFATVSDDVSDFLEAFLFANEPEGRPDDGAQPTVYDFAPEIYAALETFISGFRAYLEAQGVTSEDLDTLERSFGGNVYFSLSGHGCGFWDDRSELGTEVQAQLENYSGGKHRFEDMDMSNDETSLLDLSFIPSARKEYRDKMFSVPTATPAAPKLLIGRKGATFYLAKQADGWTGFTQLLSAAPLPVENVEAGLALCNPDEISGLTFELVDFPNVATLRALQN